MPETGEYSLPDSTTCGSPAILKPAAESAQTPGSIQPDIYERFPLTPSYYEAAVMYNVDTLALVNTLLYQSMDIPILDVKDEPLRSVTWIPGSQLGTGRTVSVDRDFHTRLMVVGKRPGSEDVRNRRVFVGEIGNLLKKTAAEVGIGSEIAAAFGTNVLRFIPFDGGKTIKPHHVRDCLPLLAREVSLIRPQFILLLGTDAVKAFFGSKQTLQRVRHRLFLMRDVRDMGTDRLIDATKVAVDDPIWRDSVKILATVHPSAVLRETGLLEGFRADLAQLRTVMGGYVRNPTPGEGMDYRYVTMAHELEPVINQALAESPVVAIDCEWGGGEWSRGGQLRCIQFSWKPGSACVVVLRHAGLIDAQAAPERLRIISLLKEFFSRMYVVGHNFRADAPWLDDLGIPAIERLCFDTMLADHALNENSEHGLESCVARYTTMGRYDWELSEWVKHAQLRSDDGYKDVPDHRLFPYGAADADATLRIYGVLRETLNKSENKSVARLFYTVVMLANFPLYEMERTGILVDFERMELLVHLYGDRKLTMIQELRDLVGDPSFNFRSIPQVVKLLFGPVAEGCLGLTPVKTTEKPSRLWFDVPDKDRKRVSPSTDAESLEALSPESEVAGKLRDIKIIDQITKNFLRPKESNDSGELVYRGGVTGEVDPDGRVRTRLSQMSETGRQRSSAPNLQNLPKRQDKETSRLMGDDVPKIRSCFIASPGCVLVEADYKSAEIFTLGYLSNDMKLVEDAKSDLHARGAVTRMGCPPWDGFNQGVPPPKEWLSTHKAMRVASKTISFGIPYQRGPKAIAREITKSTHGAVACDKDMAQGFIDGFYRDYKGVGAYVDFCKSSVLAPAYIENPYGRRRRFVISEDEAFMAAQQREGVNFPIQSTVADTLNSAMFNMWKWRKQNPGRARYTILLAVHDALVLEVPVDSLEVVCYEALPVSMSFGAVVPAWQAGPGGVPTPSFALDIDIEVMLRWGEHSESEDLRRVGVSDRIMNDFT